MKGFCVWNDGFCPLLSISINIRAQMRLNRFIWALMTMTFTNFCEKKKNIFCIHIQTLASVVGVGVIFTYKHTDIRATTTENTTRDEIRMTREIVNTAVCLSFHVSCACSVCLCMCVCIFVSYHCFYTDDLTCKIGVSYSFHFYDSYVRYTNKKLGQLYTGKSEPF